MIQPNAMHILGTELVTTIFFLLAISRLYALNVAERETIRRTDKNLLEIPLPKNINQTVSVTRLILTNNSITDLTNLTPYTKLIYFKLNQNKIGTSAGLSNICVAKSLEYLDLSNNRIRTLDFGVFDCNKNLSILLLDNNPGIKINNNSVQLENLIIVSLKYCGITIVAWDSFSGFSVLQTIYLQGNKILNPLEDTNIKAKIVYFDPITTVAPSTIANDEEGPNIPTKAFANNTSSRTYTSTGIFLTNLSSTTVTNLEYDNRVSTKSTSLANGNNTKSTAVPTMTITLNFHDFETSVTVKKSTERFDIITANFIPNTTYTTYTTASTHSGTTNSFRKDNSTLKSDVTGRNTFTSSYPNRTQPAAVKSSSGEGKTAIVITGAVGFILFVAIMFIKIKYSEHLKPNNTQHDQTTNNHEERELETLVEIVSS